MPDGEQRRPTSEDLIRRARDGFDTPVKDAPPTSRPAADGDVPVRKPIEPERTWSDGPKDPYGAPETGDDLPPGRSRMDPIQYTPPVTPSPSPVGTILRKFGGLILVGVIVLGGVVWRAFDDTKAVEDLAVGDCLAEPQDELITSVETVSCDEAHDYEVYAVVRLPDGASAPYPGDENTFFASLEACLPRFDAYVGVAYVDSIYDINTIYPTRESWEEDDDREATCLLAEYTLAGNIVPVSGSLRNSGR